MDVAAIRATVERLAIEQEHMRAELRAGLARLDGRIERVEDRLFLTQLAVLATLATTIGALIVALVA